MPARHPRATQRARRGVAVATLTLGIIGAGAASASAHVTVHPDETSPDSFSALTFRVPTESENASTTKIAVTLPQDTPFTSVSTRPVPGWTAKVTEAKLPKPVEVGGATITKAPRTVTWSASSGHGIKPGQYQEFPISVGRLPHQGTLHFPAVQTYSDGSVVKWDQVAAPGKAEPEHPAPSFAVTAAASEAVADTSGTAPEASDSGADPLARGLGGAALVLSLGGLAWLIVQRGRKGQPS